MPGKLGRPCREPRCAEIVTGVGSYCPQHLKENTKRMFADLKARPDRPERLDFYGSARWQRIRKMKLAANPYCEVCNRRPAQHVHHLKKARDEETLRYAIENLQSICPWCHAKETQAETVAQRIKNRKKE